MSGTHIGGDRDHGPPLTDALRRADIDPTSMTLQRVLPFQPEHLELRSETLALADQLGSTARDLAEETAAP